MEVFPEPVEKSNQSIKILFEHPSNHGNFHCECLDLRNLALARDSASRHALALIASPNVSIEDKARIFDALYGSRLGSEIRTLSRDATARDAIMATVARHFGISWDVAA